MVDICFSDELIMLTPHASVIVAAGRALGFIIILDSGWVAQTPSMLMPKPIMVTSNNQFESIFTTATDDFCIYLL